MIRISTLPSLRMSCDRSKDAPHTRSSKSGAGVSRHARPASTIARAQSMQGKNVVVRWAPAVDTPRRAASKMARRSACSIQTNRPSPAWRSSRSRTPAGNVLQAAISVQSRATRTAPICGPGWAQRSGEKSHLNLGAGRRALAGHVDLESSCDVRRGPAASHSALARAPCRKPSPIGPDTANQSFRQSHKPALCELRTRHARLILLRDAPLDRAVNRGSI